MVDVPDDLKIAFFGPVAEVLTGDTRFGKGIIILGAWREQ